MMAALESGMPAPTDNLAACGLADYPGAWANLDRLFHLLLGEQFVQLLPSLMAELSRCADPDRALRNLVRFIAQSFNPFGYGPRLLGSADLLRFLVQIFGFSQFLADILIRNPEYLDWLRTPGILERPKILAHYRQEAFQALNIFTGAERRRDALCRYQRKELLRIGVRDLMGMGSLSERTAELSDLAEAVVILVADEAANRLHARHGTPRAEDNPERQAVFGIIAMGKLGGRELNFSSDIDLIFLYSDEGETSGVDGQRRLSNHQFFARLGEEIIQELSRHSAEGFLYRVDMRLRPDGESGPLARSLVSAEMYYLTQARNWERLAMSKARVIYGAQRIEKSFDALAGHFVYGEPLGTEIFAQLADLKSRIDDQVVQRGHAGREVKRGIGGIREIEFIVGALQLLHGRAQQALRVRPTLQALELIKQMRLLEPEECHSLRTAYVFLRNVEHRLQMLSLAQTHTLPQSDLELHQLALRCGLQADGRLKPAEQFRQAYAKTTASVHKIFVRLFGQAQPAGDAKGIESIVDSALPPAQRFDLLRPYRFTQPAILSTFEALARGHKDYYLSAEGQQFFESILPRFLEECATTPFPEQAVRMFDNFLVRLKGITATYVFIAEQPLALRILLGIFGTSEYLGRVLQAHPEFLDVLLDSESLTHPPQPEALKTRALQFAQERHGKDFQAALCRFKETEFLAAGARRIENVVPPEATGATLSHLADACLEAAVQSAGRELAEAEALDAPPAGLGVLAMGKLAIQEMNFFSDLDLVFIHGEAPPSIADPAGFFTRWAQRVVALISDITPAGCVFKIDTRLRPEGRNAPLVAPLERYLDYYARRAQTWEFQSLVRSRPVAGEASLSQALLKGVCEPMASLAERVDMPAEVRSMRHRLEESVRLPSWAHTDFKRSRGGVVDIEFLMQYLQLKGLRDNPALLTPRFDDALAALCGSGMIQEDDTRRIERNYRFLRLLESRSRLLFSTASSYLPQKSERLEPLAYCMRDAVPEGQALTPYVNAVMNANREMFDAMVR